jgi:MoxR-like ATPase
MTDLPDSEISTAAPAASARDDVQLVAELHEAGQAAMRAIGQRIIGQQAVVEHLLIALMSRGHALFVGVPGLAKTLLIQTLAQVLDLDFNRIQFTPDLMPSDVTGTDVLEQDQSTGRRSFRFVKGPIFTNLLLADEINRASPKVQSALLEAMQERKVSIGDTTHELPAPFLVIATQNPVEQAGTFELPEAQLDRFMLRHRLQYPTAEQEQEVVRRGLKLTLKRQGNGAVPMSAFDAIESGAGLHVRDLTAAMQGVLDVHVSDVFIRDCVELVNLTRSHPDIELGCSPRAAIALVQASRARAWIHGRDFAVPEDFFALAEDVILHRMRLSYEALADGRRGEDVLAEILRTLA